jgi:hypothetical protein
MKIRKQRTEYRLTDKGPPITVVQHAILLMAGTDNRRREGTSEAINMTGLYETVANTKGRKIMEDSKITSKKRRAGGLAGRQNKLKESNK